MAENINLVGNFTDNITPKLKKLNRELTNVSKSFTKMGRKIRPVTREMGKLAVATDRVADNLKMQRQSLNATTQAMRAYTTASRKATSQQKKMRGAAIPGTARGPQAGGGPRAGLSVGALAAGGAAFGATAGAQMRLLVNEGLRMGFDYGKTIIMGAFQKFGSMIGERIEDEMSDIQSAGGMFALDKKQDPSERLFANFTQARNMQELLNRELAKSAAALPGATSDYVQSAKQLTDTVFGTFAKDKEAFAELAVSLGGKEGGTATEDITKVLSRFTEQSVLLSQGAGKGGMPLGMLLEQLISQETVNVKGLKRRYAQLRKNPLLANMLEDAEEAINASGAMTADRFAAVMGALDNALPEEVINSMRRSVSGVTESIRSAFLDPEVGLLGLGRPLKSSVKSINSFGQYIDENGKVVQNAADAAKESTTVFKLLRDIMAGFGGAIGEISQIMPQVFDPLVPLADALMEMREQAVEFAQMFTGMTNYIKASGLDDAAARGGIAAFSKMLENIGAIDASQHQMNVDAVMSKDADFASVVPRIIQQLLKSDFAEQLGKTIGEVMGTIIATIGNMMAGVTSEVMDSGLAKGFMDGWNAAGGSAGIKQIFATIFGLMKDLLLLAIKEAPMEMLTIALIGLAPALAAGFMAAAPSLLPMILPAVGNAIMGLLTNLVTAIAAGAGGAIVATIGAIVIAAIGTSLLYKPIMDFLEWAKSSLLSIAPSWMHGLIEAWSNMFMGIVNLLGGLGDILIGVFTLNWGKIVDGIVKMLTGIAQLIQGALGVAWGGVGAIVGAIKGLFQGIWNWIKGLDPRNWFGGGGEPTAAQQASQDRNSRRGTAQFNGSKAPTTLGAAINSEMKNKPKGSHLVIANSSETVIPANKGYSPNGMGGGVSLSGVTINVNGVDDPKAVANVVAEEILAAIQKSTYTELYTT